MTGTLFSVFCAMLLVHVPHMMVCVKTTFSPVYYITKPE